MSTDTVPFVPMTRFAPSPTGLLHLGHAFAALRACEAAHDAPILLRIEDLDRGRARAEYDSALREDLAWLGLRWHEPVLRQSTRADAYRIALARLEQAGLVYPCFCSRRDIVQEIARAAEAPQGPDGPLCPGTCRSLSPQQRDQRLSRGEKFALRLDAAKAAAASAGLTFTETGAGPGGEHGEIQVEPSRLGDVVLASDGLPAAYHLAVVVDDAFQGVTLVTRGNDLFSATHVQRVLQSVLGLPAPRYAHHRLILDTDGRKLSKREHATTLRSLREAGHSSADIRRGLGL